MDYEIHEGGNITIKNSTHEFHYVGYSWTLERAMKDFQKRVAEDPLDLNAAFRDDNEITPTG